MYQKSQIKIKQLNCMQKLCKEKINVKVKKVISQEIF